MSDRRFDANLVVNGDTTPETLASDEEHAANEDADEAHERVRKANIRTTNHGDLENLAQFRGRGLLETLTIVDNAIQESSTLLDIQMLQQRKHQISSIPYFPVALRQEYNAVADVYTQLLSADTTKDAEAAHSSCDDNGKLERILPFLDLDDRELVEGSRSRINVAERLFRLKLSDQRIQFLQCMNQCLPCLNRMITEATKATGTLNCLAGMPQAETTQTTGPSLSRRSEKAAEILAAEKMAGRNAYGGTSDGVREIFEGKTPLDVGKFLKVDVTTGERARSYEKLSKLAGVWEKLILQSISIRPNDKEATVKINESIDWMRKQILEDSMSLGVGGTFVPNVVSGEVKSAQPALLGLLNFIADCWTDFSEDKSSPYKTQVKQNQIIPATAKRKKRIADVCLDKPGRFHLVMVDFAIKLLFEMKPLLRKNQYPDDLDEESLQQVVGHLAKYVGQCFDFFGCGVSSFATGLTGSLAYIKVIKLQLVLKEATKKGKELTNFSLQVSDRLPLMTCKAFKDWVKKATPEGGYCRSQQESLDKLCQDLYGKDEKQGCDGMGIPLGMRVLWELMSHRQKDLFGPDCNKLSSCGKIECFISSGRFGNVFALKDNDTVVKVPAFLGSYDIKQEMLALKELNRFRKPHNRNLDTTVALPVLEAFEKYKFQLGGVPFSIDGLVLSPKGIPMSDYLKTKRKRSVDSLDFVHTVMDKISGALRFMHSRDWLHLDVAPWNLILVERNNILQPILVDFSLAAKKGAKIVGFRGSPDFAHKAMFLSYPGQEQELDNDSEDFDFLGLALTLCDLCNRCKATWDMRGFPRSVNATNRDDLERKLRERQSQANIIIEREKFDSERKKKLLSWLSLENLNQSSTRKRKVH